jgi:hypothetical protein
MQANDRIRATVKKNPRKMTLFGGPIQSEREVKFVECRVAEEVQAVGNRNRGDSSWKP